MQILYRVNVVITLVAVAAVIILILLIPVRFKLRLHLDALRLSGGFCAAVFGITAYCGDLAIENGALAFYDRHGIPTYTDISLIPRKRAKRGKQNGAARTRRGGRTRRADKRNKCADKCEKCGEENKRRESLPSFFLRRISWRSVHFSSEVGVLADPFAACIALSVVRTAVSAALGVMYARKGIESTASYGIAYDKTEVKFELNGIFFMSVANIILCAATLIYRSKRIGKSPASAIVLSSPFAVRQKR
jgi:hypothetical protein